MPPLFDEKIRRKVIQQWISGFPRDKIAADNDIGAGTVSSIIANYKAGLESLDFDSIRQLSIEARQHGLNLSELALHFRLYNYFVKSGAAEDKIESFIDNINSSYLPPDKVVFSFFFSSAKSFKSKSTIRKLIGVLLMRWYSVNEI
jgi:hypothetical protein